MGFAESVLRVTVARSNPLALGVYWLDVFSPSPTGSTPNQVDGLPTFKQWISDNAGAVTITKNEEFPVTGQPLRNFYVFQVSAPPSEFPFAKLGFPEIVKLGAPDQIKPADTQVTSDDTVRKPPPEPLFDTSIFTETVKGIAIVGGTLFVLQALGTAWINRRAK